MKKYVSAKVSGDNETSRRTGLTILAIIAALGVGLLLTALVCSISCNGSAAAALIVGIVGFAALIWGTIALVKHINRKHPKKE